MAGNVPYGLLLIWNVPPFPSRVWSTIAHFSDGQTRSAIAKLSRGHREAVLHDQWGSVNGSIFSGLGQLDLDFEADQAKWVSFTKT